ncbi:TPA: cell shape determination protein CcmA, partial [Candidatus Sumerlaeota bacterium]|nr:cell shape determination protein CcmA [Candidatus Sumerlaeota bacterium]
ISGKVVGNLRISERLEVLATGEVFGDLETQPGALIIEKGAKIEGRLSMGLKSEE